MTDFINIFLPPAKISLKVGLFFGSFNPVHIGHMVIANYMAEFTEIDQVWFVVSPHNPFKKIEDLLNDYDRLEMMNKAVGNDQRFMVSDVEFRLPKPSYTFDTLSYLGKKFPGYHFSLIMGSDNVENFRQWKSYEYIVENHEIMVYPRPGYDNCEEFTHRNIRVLEAPLLEISATFLRQSIRDGKNMSRFFPPEVWEYIDRMRFYR